MCVPSRPARLFPGPVHGCALTPSSSPSLLEAIGQASSAAPVASLGVCQCLPGTSKRAFQANSDALGGLIPKTIHMLPSPPHHVDTLILLTFLFTSLALPR